MADGPSRGRKAAPRRCRSVWRHWPSSRTLLYAQDRWAVLLIFQALDAAGKDRATQARGAALEAPPPRGGQKAGRASTSAPGAVGGGPPAPPPADARRQELVGAGVTDLAFDLRVLDEPPRLGVQRPAAWRHVDVASGAQHVQDRIRSAGLGDRETDSHDAGLRLVDQLEPVAEASTDGTLEVGHQAE